MSELRIIRGSDIRLYAGDEPLFGVTAFSAVQKQRFHEVYEYLRTATCERIEQGSSYEIEVSMMTLFDRQLPMDDSFLLQVVDGNVTYSYHNCRVTGRKMSVKGNGTPVEVFSLESDRMEKAVSET